jgi:hypothetical protein
MEKLGEDEDGVGVGVMGIDVVLVPDRGGLISLLDCCGVWGCDDRKRRNRPISGMILVSVLVEGELGGGYRKIRRVWIRQRRFSWVPQWEGKGRGECGVGTLGVCGPVRPGIRVGCKIVDHRSAGRRDVTLGEEEDRRNTEITYHFSTDQPYTFPSALANPSQTDFSTQLLSSTQQIFAQIQSYNYLPLPVCELELELEMKIDGVEKSNGCAHLRNTVKVAIARFRMRSESVSRSCHYRLASRSIHS